MKWTPVRKIWAAAAAFVTSAAGLGLLDALHVQLGQTWPGIVVGAIPVVVGYLVPNATKVPPQ